MLSAIVLLTTERDKTNKVAEALADTDGVSEVYSVAGRYDLAAIVRASRLRAATQCTRYAANMRSLLTSRS